MKKEFWKSRTIVVAFLAFVALILDYLFGWGIEPLIQEGGQTVFTGETDQIEGLNITAIVSLIFAIYMRTKTSTGLAASAQEAQEAQAKTVGEKIEEAKARFFEIPTDVQEGVLATLKMEYQKRLNQKLRNEGKDFNK